MVANVELRNHLEEAQENNEDKLKMIHDDMEDLKNNMSIEIQIVVSSAMTIF